MAFKVAPLVPSRVLNVGASCHSRVNSATESTPIVTCCGRARPARERSYSVHLRNSQARLRQILGHVDLSTFLSLRGLLGEPISLFLFFFMVIAVIVVTICPRNVFVWWFFLLDHVDLFGDTLAILSVVPFLFAL